MTIDISVRITQIKVYVYDCICFHVSNTMLFSPQHSNGPWIVRSRRVHSFEIRSEKELIRLCCDRKSDDAIIVNILSGSNVSLWLKSMHMDAKRKETYVRASTVETKHFDKLRSEIEHHHNDDSMRTLFERECFFSLSRCSFNHVNSLLTTLCCHKYSNTNQLIHINYSYRSSSAK